MSDFLDQYARQFRAAAETEAARGRRVTAAPLVVAAVAAAAVAVAVIGNEQATRDVERERPAPVAGARDGGYQEQRELLEVLRRPTKRDRDPQVRQTMRELRELRPRAGRLLGFAPSGSAYVLLATREYSEHVMPPPPYEPSDVPEVRTHRDGLCLYRRGTQGGGGGCVGTAEFRANGLNGAMAGEVFGVVPDGVTHVLPPRRDRPVRVRRNFFVYPARGHPGPTPIWLDAKGNEVPRATPRGQFAYVNAGGHGSLEDLRGQVAVVLLWASWCRPCMPQLDVMRELDERARQRGGFNVVGIATKDLTARARTALERRRITFMVFNDPRGTLASRFDVRAFPETLVLFADGRLAERFRGPVTAEQVEAAIARAR